MGLGRLGPGQGGQLGREVDQQLAGVGTPGRYLAAASQ